VSEFTKTKDGKVQFCIKKIEPYPHLFQLLPWWSDRKVEDMPEYLKLPDNGRMWKIECWYGGPDCCYYCDKGFANETVTLTAEGKLPATREDYEHWKQSKNK
jgi:hypothetical protein